MIISRNLKLLLLLIAGCLVIACNHEPYHQGKVLYEYHCASCHMSDGSGLEKLIPPLKNADYLLQKSELLPCIIRYGLKDTIKVNGIIYSDTMPGIPNLSNVEISNICNYLYTAWNHNIEPKTIVEIEAMLQLCNR